MLFRSLRDGYLECIQRMVDQLHVDAVRCSTMHELKNRIDHENYQFLFVADVEYFIDQSYFDSLSAKMKVVVMATGIPVHLEIIFAISSSVTLSCTKSRFLFCTFFSASSRRF